MPRSNLSPEARKKSQKEASARFYRRHTEKVLANNKAWKDANRELCAEYELKRLYGISMDERNALLSSQDGLCAVCHTPPQKICVDHCHHTGRVRGILCDNCNKALGLLRDNPSTLSAAIDYLITNTFTEGRNGEQENTDAGRGDTISPDRQGAEGHVREQALT